MDGLKDNVVRDSIGKFDPVLKRWLDPVKCFKQLIRCGLLIAGTDEPPAVLDTGIGRDLIHGGVDWLESTLSLRLHYAPHAGPVDGLS